MMIDRSTVAMVVLTLFASVTPGLAAQNEEPAGDQRSLVQSARDALDQIEDSNDPDARRRLLEDVNRTIEVLRAAEPDNPWLIYLRGRSLAIVGRDGDAIEQLQRFVETREGRSEWEAYRLLGNLLVREFPSLARANYRKAAALKDNDPQTTFGLSLCAAKLGDANEATELAARAVSLDQRRTVRYVAHLATLLRGAGRYDDAMEQAESALDLAKSDAERTPTPAAIRSVYDHYGLVISILDERIKAAESPSGDDYLRLAGLMMERGDVSTALVRHEAIRALQGGIERLSPAVPPLMLERCGTLLAAVGRVDEAVAMFERLLAADPGNRAAIEALATLRTSQGEAP